MIGINERGLYLFEKVAESYIRAVYHAAVCRYICYEAAVPYIRSVEHISSAQHRVYQALPYDSWQTEAFQHFFIQSLG